MLLGIVSLYHRHISYSTDYEPKLNFTKEPDAKIVNSYYRDQKDGDENARIYLLWRTPILDDQSSSR